MCTLNRTWLVSQNKECWMRRRHMTYTNIFFPWFSINRSTTMKERLKFLLQLTLKEFIITLQKCFRGNLALIVFSWEHLTFSNKSLWNVQEYKCHEAPKGAMTHLITKGSSCVACLKNLKLCKKYLIFQTAFQTSNFESDLALKYQSGCSDLVCLKSACIVKSTWSCRRFPFVSVFSGTQR